MNRTDFVNYPPLSGMRVLITGGAGGIGASMVEHFSHQGARVAFLDRDDDAAQALIVKLCDEGLHTPLFINC